MPKVEIIEDSMVFEGFNRLRKLQLRYRRHDGAWSSRIEREIFERRDAVVVLPYDPVRDQIVLIEQFRPGAFAAGRQCWQLEPIGGLLEDGVEVSALVRREAMEEAGCTLLDLVPIGNLMVSPGCATELVHTYCGRVDASALGGNHGCTEEDEDTLVHVIDYPRAAAMLAAGEFEYLITAYCLLWLSTRRDELRRRWAG